jgi:hypothetical protein
MHAFHTPSSRSTVTFGGWLVSGSTVLQRAHHNAFTRQAFAKLDLAFALHILHKPSRASASIVALQVRSKLAPSTRSSMESLPPA